MTGPDPVLLISDLLPAQAIEGDPTRAYPLVLADYRPYFGYRRGGNVVGPYDESGDGGKDGREGWPGVYV